MEGYLIDTNIVSDYFSLSLPDSGLKFMDGVIDAIPNISIITEIELRCWKTNTSNENKVIEFISDCRVYDISADVINQCVSLRKTIGIKIPDAIIAATAIANDLILVTNNEKDFKRVKGLKMINPHKS